MKSVVFGNPSVGCWRLSFDGASRSEQVICVKGQLETSFFCAMTPICLRPEELQSFASELEALNSTLAGVATLRADGSSTLNWTLRALPHGHIESAGQFSINRNTLDFTFQTDQTQLAPLLKWVRSLLNKYEKCNE
jgi:hypothetical protein